MSQKKHEHKEIKGQLGILVCIMLADNKIEESEKEFYFYVAEKLSVSKEVADNILNDPKSVKFTKPRFLDVKREQMINLLSMIVVDGKIDDREISMCQKYATFIGLPKDNIPEAAQVLLDLQQDKITKQEANAKLDILL